MKRIQTTTVNTFKSNLYVDSSGNLKTRVMKQEKETLEELRAFWKDQLKAVQLHIMSLPDYEGKYDLNSQRVRDLNNLHLLKQIESFQRNAKEIRQVRRFFFVSMAILITAFLCLIINYKL